VFHSVEKKLKYTFLKIQDGAGHHFVKKRQIRI